MKYYRKTAVIIGVLYIVGTVTGILSAIFTSGILKDPAYLTKISQNNYQMIVGAIFVLIMGFSLAMIPILIYPVLKKYNQTLAIGYVVFRSCIETLTYFFTVISLLLLLPLSREFINSDGQFVSYFYTTGKLLRSISELPMTVFAFGFGALIFYIVLFQSKLIPRWISIWGLIAIIIHLTTGFLILFGLQTSFSVINSILNFPIFLQEMVLAVWLIVKGFNQSVIDKMNEK